MEGWISLFGEFKNLATYIHRYCYFNNTNNNGTMSVEICLI